MGQIRGRRMLLAGTVAATWIAAAAAIPFLPERYTATASVLVGPDDRPSITGGQAPSDDAWRIESELAIIASRTLAERVIAHLGLYRDSDLVRPAAPAGPDWLPAWARAMLGLDADRAPDPLRADRMRAHVIDAFLSRLDVTRQGESRVIEVAFTSDTARRAAAVANAVAETYVIDKAEKRFSQSKRASEWMDKRLTELRRKAEESEGAVEALRRNASVAQEAGIERVREMAELRRRIAEIGARRDRVEETLEKAEAQLRAGRAEGVIETLGSEALRHLHAYIVRLQHDHDALSDRVDAADPRLVNMGEEIRSAKQQFASTATRAIQKLRTDDDAASAGQAALHARLTRLERAAQPERPAPMTRLVSLQHEAKSHRALYEEFLAQVKRTTMFYGVVDPAVRIISRADIPVAPSFPPMPDYLVAAFAAALLAGLAVVVVAARLDRGFRSLEQIERDTGMPALALVPSVPGFGWWRKTPEDYMLEKPVSAYSESVRSLHTRLMFSGAGAAPRLVMVASAAPNEGKTSLALALARTAGRVDQKRIVVVDCDLRHPQVHRRLGLDRAPGLVEYLMEEATLEDVLQVDVRTNALVIAAGRAPPNSVELLASDRFRDLLAKLSAACDLVILDSSPVLAVCDFHVLAPMVDQTVFVARWATTRRKVVERAMGEIRSAGGTLAGVALTRVNVRRHARFGYGDSGVYHGSYLKYYSG